MATRTTIVVVAALAFCAVGQAAVLNINWNRDADNYTGQGILSDPGNNSWNRVGAGDWSGSWSGPYSFSRGSLVFSDGSPAPTLGVTVTTTGGSWGWDGFGPDNTLRGGFWWGQNNSNAVMTVTGLLPNTNYTVTAMAVRPSASGRVMSLNINGTTQQITGNDINSDAANWATFPVINSGASGVIEMRPSYVSGDSWNQYYFNAVQIQGSFVTTLDYYGRVVMDASGSLAGAAYAKIPPGGTPYSGPVDWKLERAATLGGPRTLVTTGAVTHGSEGADAAFLAPAPGLDGGFESGSFDPARWQAVAGGGGNSWAIVNSCAGYAGPVGSYMLGLTDGNARDDAHNLLIARSQPFELGPGDLTFKIQGGQSSGVIPTGLVSLNPVGSGSGYMGVALRDDVTGEFLLTDRRDGNSNSWQDQGWTAAQLAAFLGRTVTLDVIDNYVGGWGWIGVDAFAIPNSLPIAPGEDFWFLTVGGEEVFAGQFADIPEPATMLLVGLGLAGVCGRLRRRRIA